jgi:hypothetical protein
MEPTQQVRRGSAAIRGEIRTHGNRPTRLGARGVRKYLKKWQGKTGSDVSGPENVAALSADKTQLSARLSNDGHYSNTRPRWKSNQEYMGYRSTTAPLWLALSRFDVSDSPRYRSEGWHRTTSCSAVSARIGGVI